MAVDVQYMSTHEVAQSLCSARLEQIYQQALSQTERIYEEERARQLRVQLLLLEDENDELREQMLNDEDDMQVLETTNEELRDKLADIESHYQAVQMDLKAQLRDLDRYKTEVTALNATRTDANTLLVEKLALSRELAILRPELDHLQSQANTQQKLLGQKLALERELLSAQVELETEKRAVQRLKAKDKSSTSSADAALSEEIEDLKTQLQKERRVAKEASFKDATRVERIEELEQELTNVKRKTEKNNAADTALSEEVDDLKKQLEKEKRKTTKSASNDAGLSQETEELKKDLAKARRDASKMERENLKKATEWDSQKEALEEKLDAFRTKLRTTKEQLKEAQDELEKAQHAKFAAATEASKARLTGANPRKRNVARFDPDMTIGTPGQGGPAKKQRISVNANDKSNFSITPFLNKTLSILPESPEDRIEHGSTDKSLSLPIDMAAAEADRDQSEAVENTSKKAKPTKRLLASKAQAKKPLQESTNPKANAAMKKSSLSKVIEEEDDEVTKPQQNVNDETDIEVNTKKAVIKRPTIFDDEDEAAPKKTKKLKLGGLKASGLGMGKINLAGKNKILAEFSPLKKDRTAVVAL